MLLERTIYTRRQYMSLFLLTSHNDAVAIINSSVSGFKNIDEYLKITMGLFPNDVLVFLVTR